MKLVNVLKLIIIFHFDLELIVLYLLEILNNCKFLFFLSLLYDSMKYFLSPATILSRRALEAGLNQSLFERLYKLFKYDLNNPIRMLNIVSYLFIFKIIIIISFSNIECMMKYVNFHQCIFIDRN